MISDYPHIYDSAGPHFFCHSAANKKHKDFFFQKCTTKTSSNVVVRKHAYKKTLIYDE